VLRCATDPLPQKSQKPKQFANLRLLTFSEPICHAARQFIQPSFLTGIDLGKADVASVISREPRLLCCKVDKTISPRVTVLLDLGLSPPEISSLITASPSILRKSHCNVVPARKFAQCSSRIGANAFSIKMSSLCPLVKLNMTFLHQRGLNDCKIAKLMLTPIVLLEPEYAKEIVECADKLGVARPQSNLPRLPFEDEYEGGFPDKAVSWML
jgi:hypothetical protein